MKENLKLRKEIEETNAKAFPANDCSAEKQGPGKKKRDSPWKKSKNVITYLLSEVEQGASMFALSHLSCSGTRVPEEPQG